MKKLFPLAIAFLWALNVGASDPQLVVQRIDNGNTVAGTTYRLYAKVAAPATSVYMVWGTAEHPLFIRSTALFYQDALGGYSASMANPNNFGFSPGLKYDSWITVGHDNQQGNGMWDIGFDFSSFNQGGAIESSNGAWFLLPDDQKASASAQGLVLLGQFTTTGVVTGQLNLQGKSAGTREAWKAFALTFSTNNAQIFGCTDPNATNYAADATFNDGSCVLQESIPLAVDVESFTPWSVFPNPVRTDLIHLQFVSGFKLGQGNTQVEVIDMSGRVLLQQQLNTTDKVSLNQYTLHHNLAAGTYKLVLKNGQQVESQTIVVAK